MAQTTFLLYIVLVLISLWNGVTDILFIQLISTIILATVDKCFLQLAQTLGAHEICWLFLEMIK